MSEEVGPLNCAECGAAAEVLFSERRIDKFDVRCTNSLCHRDLDCRRQTRKAAVKFWNKIQAAKLAGTYKPKTNVTAKMDDPMNVARCKCSLALPCEDCLKPITFYADSRHSDYDPPAAKIRKQFVD